MARSTAGGPVDHLRRVWDALPEAHVLLLPVRDDAGEVVDFQIAEANKAAGRLHGRKRKALIGSQLLSVLSDDEATRTFRLSCEALTAGSTLTAEAAGSMLRVVPVGDAVACTWRDSAANWEDSRHSLVAAARYQAVVDALTDAVLRVDADGVIRWVSAPLLDWAPEDLVGCALGDIVDAGDPVGSDRGGGVSVLTMPGDRPVTVIGIRDRAGISHPLSLVAVRDPAGGDPAGVIVGVRDVSVLTDALQRGAVARQLADQARMFMDQSTIGMAMADRTGRFTYVNAALAQLLDFTPEELVGRTFVDITAPGDVVSGRDAVAQMLAGDLPSLTTRKRYLNRSGGIVWADVAVTPVRNAAGNFDHFAAQVVDVTSEVAANEALQRSVRRFRLLAENASDIVYRTDLNGVIEWISPSVSEVLGWDPELLVGTKSTALVASADLARVSSSRSRVIRGFREEGVLAQFLTVRGGRRWMSVSAKPILGEDDNVAGAVVALRDVDSEQRAHQDLALAQERFRLAMDVAPQGMALTDANGVVVDVNPAAARLLGVERSEMLGARLSEVLSAQAGDCASDERHEHVRTTSDGESWIDHISSRLSGDDVAGSGFVVHQFVDETEDRIWMRELEHRASHDVLTGVANRRSLLTHLDRLLDAGRATGRMAEGIGVLFVDVDNLKQINDAHGHHVGDAVLARIADRVARALRRGDRVGRIGGDEFVVVLDGVDSEAELRRVAEKARLAARRPMDIDGQQIHATVSIGAALVGESEDADSVLTRADAALYAAKAAGRDCVQVHADGPATSPGGSAAAPVQHVAGEHEAADSAADDDGEPRPGIGQDDGAQQDQRQPEDEP